MFTNTNQITYNRAKTWQIAGFALNNTATNLFMMLMTYVSFYATGVAGLSVILISSLLTSMRMFDAVTDPIIGFIIDKTSTKFGKFRPSIILGYAIMSVSVLVLYNFTHVVPENIRLIFFIVTYGLYIVGYTFQTACTKAAQACLTNDPSQRPLFTRFDSIFNLFLFAAIAQYTSSYLSPKYGGFTAEAMQEFSTTFVILAGIGTLVAVISIWSKDREEYFGLGGKTVKTKFRDYLSVLKGNRAMQMLIVAASTDKLALQTANNSVVMVMLYGIVMGNYALYGKMSMITMIPSFIIILLGTRYASKFGSKKALVVSTWLSIIGYVALFLVLFLGDPNQISLENFGIMTALWIGTFSLAKGISSISSGIVIPMIADCADYETYLTGRYVPGMMGTLFSFVDKMVSSFATTIIGFAVAAIGFTTAMPQATDAYTQELFWVTTGLFMGLPILGWICSLIAMKFYPLDERKMAEVQEKISEMKKDTEKIDA
ncbi:glucuronide permease [Romboutsia ilealis]|uniref:MFS transporter n=1 Tax=Romboutsia faecis TaxID=2764597 RepID=A0ABR7JJM8_9FIRM|nr:MFS transporter [Romboutsia faecis]MBC5995140.1 MFS transporter [Romboutsia faecis]MRN26055.1 glucuronide permease [Romboutsia ilealis]